MTTFKFNHDADPHEPTDGEISDLLEGHLDPADYLTDPAQIKLVINAINLLYDFVAQGYEAGVFLKE